MPLRTDDHVYRPSTRVTRRVVKRPVSNKRVERRVNSSEVNVNIIAPVKAWAVQTIRKPKVGLGIGLGFAALAGAPMPLPQLALVGPWVAACAMGAVGARVAAGVGLLSYVFFGHPGFLASAVAAVIALLMAWGVPKLLVTPVVEVEEEGEAPRADNGASAVVIDCDGFSSLDETYGVGAADHVFRLLRRSLEIETRQTDLVVHAQGQELILILDGSSPVVARAVMERVERRFSGWLSDAGYECNLSVGLANMDEEEGNFDSILREARRIENKPYLD